MNTPRIAASARKDVDSLAEALRRRREGCQEFESVPDQSTADATAATSIPAGSGGEACSEPARQEPFQPEPRTGIAAASEKPQEAGSAGRAAPSGARHAGDEEVRSWMARLRGECQVLESKQEESVADVQAAHKDGSEQGGDREPGQPAEPLAVGSRQRTKTADLQKWMQRMRDRCEVHESEAGSTTADARNEDAELYAGRSSSKQPEPQAPPALSVGASPLDTSARDALWSQALQERPPGAVGDPGDDEAAPRLPVSLARLLLGGPPPDTGEVFDMAADDSDEGEDGEDAPIAPAVGDPKLAAAFVAKFLPWLPSCKEGAAAHDAVTRSVFRVLALLLRYHCPSVACGVEACAAASMTDSGQQHAASRELSTVLATAMGGSRESGAAATRALCEALFRGADRDALLLFCDLLVEQSQPLLLLLAVVLLLAELAPEPDESLARLGSRLRGPEGLGGLGANGADGVRRCILGARALLDATPPSLLSLVMNDDGTVPVSSQPDAEQPSLVICTVSAAEVLHHAFERPTGAWRLIVVDVRMRPSEWALPVCVRLPPAQHTQRRQLLLDMPFEEQIHLCLVGDSHPVPGEDAFQLCKFLAGPKAKRRHVSVVEGGWPAVEDLARTLRLDLMPLGPEASLPPLPAREPDPATNSSATPSAGAAAAVGQAAGRAAEFAGQVTPGAAAEKAAEVVGQAAERAAEFAGQVGAATETAVNAGQKVAKHVWAAASGKALKLFGSGARGQDKGEDGAGRSGGDEDCADDGLEPVHEEGKDKAKHKEDADKQTLKQFLRDHGFDKSASPEARKKKASDQRTAAQTLHLPDPFLL